MNQDFISQTPLDQITGTDYGQMLKAAIPYLPARSRQILSNYEKAMELLKQERVEKHRTFDDTGIICITKVNHDHLWACVRPDDTVELIWDSTHQNYDGKISDDLTKITWNVKEVEIL